MHGCLYNYKMITTCLAVALRWDNSSGKSKPASFPIYSYEKEYTLFQTINTDMLPCN